MKKTKTGKTKREGAEGGEGGGGGDSMTLIVERVCQIELAQVGSRAELWLAWC